MTKELNIQEQEFVSGGCSCKCCCHDVCSTVTLTRDCYDCESFCGREYHCRDGSKMYIYCDSDMCSGAISPKSSMFAVGVVAGILALVGL